MNADTPKPGHHRKPGPEQAPGTAGQTTTHVDGEPAPRLPHEHDESADSQADPQRPVIRQAHADLEAGRVDTDRGPPMDELYEQQMRKGTPTPPQPPHGRRRG